MDLAAVILALAAVHGHHDVDRLRAVAQDIEDVSRESILMVGPARVEATELALVAVAEHESGWHPGVQDCSRCDGKSLWCDRGRSVSLYQLHVGSGAWRGFSRADICQDNGVASRLALRILERHRRSSAAAGIFHGYARGARIGAGAEMAGLYQRLADRAGIVVSSIGGRLTATWRSTP